MVVSGQLDRRDEAPKFRAAQLLSLSEAGDQLLTTLVLRLSLDDWLDPRAGRSCASWSWTRPAR